MLSCYLELFGKGLHLWIPPLSGSDDLDECEKINENPFPRSY